MFQLQIKKDHYTLMAIKNLLINKEVISEEGVKEAAEAAAIFESEENRKFRVEWWKAHIRIGSRAKYNGYEGMIISFGPEPWGGLVIQPDKGKLVAFNYIGQELMVYNGSNWESCA